MSHRLVDFPKAQAWHRHATMKLFSRFTAARFAFRMTVVVAVAVPTTIAAPQVAMAQNVPVVRDAEIEALVRDYAKPILAAAGLGNSGIDIVLVNDRSFNAFVAGRRIFVNTGLLLTAETPNEVIGVLAHEAGHLAGGHQERLRQQLERAQTMAIVGMLLGVGAAAAGAATNNRGLAEAGGGIGAGAGEVARRSLLGYQRTEEATADRSAVKYLEATKQSAKGMLRTFSRFQTALSLSGGRVDPYKVSHPLPRDRYANMETLATSSRYFDKVDPPALQQRHDMMRAKIAVFTQGGAGGLARLKGKISLDAVQYGQAIAAYLSGNPRSALTKIDALAKSQPKNPYVQELKGDALVRANRPDQAVDAYSRAIKLDPSRSAIIQISMGQALIATGDRKSLEKATNVLQQALSRDKENPSGYQYLAQAYGQLGRVGEADLAIADQNFYLGKYFDAQVFAARAQQRLKRGSPAWVRAQDIINFKGAKQKGRG